MKRINLGQHGGGAFETAKREKTERKKQVAKSDKNIMPSVEVTPANKGVNMTISSEEAARRQKHEDFLKIDRITPEESEKWFQERDGATFRTDFVKYDPVTGKPPILTIIGASPEENRYIYAAAPPVTKSNVTTYFEVDSSGTITRVGCFIPKKRGFL